MKFEQKTQHIKELEFGIEIMRCECVKDISSHKHEFIEVVFIVEGSCKHRYLNRESTLLPGDIFVIAPGEMHEYIIDNKAVIYNCLFIPSVLHLNWGEIRKIDGLFDFLMIEPFFREEEKVPVVLHTHSKELDSFINLLEIMIKEQNKRIPGFEIILKSYLMIIIIELSRLFNKYHKDNKLNYSSKRELLSSAIEYIEDNIQEDINVGEVASMVYLSTSYFRRLFKMVTGLTPNEYINKIRVARAEQLLLSSELSITQISSLVGVGDVNYFSRLFKKHNGLSPTEYKNRNILC